MVALTVLFALAVPASDDAATEKHAAIAYLRGLQTPSGGFVSSPPAKGKEGVPSLRTTRTALRAFRLLDGGPADREAVVKFVKACHDAKSGGFSDRPGVLPDPISTSVGLMALVELGLPTDPYLDGALRFMGAKTAGFEEIRMVASGLEAVGRQLPESARWLDTIDAARNPDGSYGEGPGQARTTALYVVAQQRLGAKPASNAAVLKILRSGQREDGGFGGDRAGGSDLEACYRIVRVLRRLDGVPADPAKLRDFVARCRNADGGFGVRPEQPSSLQGTYYATIVRYWLDGGKRN